ncbi:hypothetical protein LMH87_009464 [Akanthomyces muscarius]|uniref:RBR-type E3 ubiquitin transferase n=1 Tax=Akanthomyces muscarius TaxID=2231603 RepID=A0A9W8QCZ5_AKAMU|nr:hypothetical protein LMH87_009464 [Akanthomyces muscarius]KAJ4152947.1 hypothetical protein LMH87_009464 [Akanthomyces muscarius]
MEMDEEMDPATLNLILELQFQDAQDAASRRDHGPSSFFRGRQRQRQRRSLETLDRELAMDLQQHEFDEFEQRRRRRATAPDMRPSTTRRTRTRYEDTGGDDSDDDPDLLAALAASRMRVNNHAGFASSSSAAARHEVGGDDSDDDPDLLAALAASDDDPDLLAALAASRIRVNSNAGAASSRSAVARHDIRGGDDSNNDDDLLAALAASRISARNHAALAASRIHVNSHAGAASSRSAVARHDIRGGDDSDNDDDLLAALAASRISARIHAALAASRVSASNHAGPSSSSAAAPECVSCMEAIRPPSSAIHLPCSHRYCAGCMTRVLGAALDDDGESRFPARCCAQPLPVAEDPASSALLPADLVARYRARQREHGARNRTYCRSCGQFIPPESVHGNRATCIWCEAATCAWCKEAWHGEGECPADGAALETLRMAEERGWKRCPECRTLVELSTGCNHMTCRCGAEFCYSCGEEWGPCRCRIVLPDGDQQP